MTTTSNDSQRTWSSLGFVKGKTVREAVENSGHEYVSHSGEDGFIDVQTTTNTLQALVCEGDRFLLLRLVERDKGVPDTYVPSGKRPRQPRADKGKPRKKGGAKAPSGFKIVDSVPDDN